MRFGGVIALGGVRQMKSIPYVPLIIMLTLTAIVVMQGCGGCVNMRARSREIIANESTAILNRQFDARADSYVRGRVDRLKPWLILVAALIGAGGTEGLRRFVKGVRRVSKP